jgi:hypothetical protein
MLLEMVFTVMGFAVLVLAAIGAGTVVALIDERRVARSRDHRRVRQSHDANAAKVP